MGSLLPLEQFEREKGNPKSPRIKICTSVVVLQLSIEKHAGRIETLRRVIPELNPAILRFYNYRLSIFRTNSLLGNDINSNWIRIFKNSLFYLQFFLVLFIFAIILKTICP